ncbi:MAG: DnaJ domain-containing protein [Anaerolineales bacterium]|nr:DnaJ domain-containing protein [Anaerolineales bacterium]
MPTDYLDNYYARLGIAKHASIDEIKVAYHQAARKLHPDTNDDEQAVELFLQIQKAYNVLIDPEKRKAYDTSLPEDIDSLPEVYINAVYSRKTLPNISQPQLVYVLLDLMSVPELYQLEGESNPPMNVCLVLDTSTSMKGARLNVVKATTQILIQKLHPSDVFSIVLFNDRPELLLPASRNKDYNRVHNLIASLQTNGGTELYQGLKLGIDQVRLNLDPAFVNHVVLLTDGHTYGDESQCLELASMAAEEGITISGLGIGNEWNDDFLDDLTGITGGVSLYTEKAKDIQEILLNKFKNINNIFANQVKLDLLPNDNVEVRYAFRITPEPSSLKIMDQSINIGAIHYKTNLSIIIEFLIKDIPVNCSNFRLAEGYLNMSIPKRAIPKVKSRFVLSRPVDIDPDISPPPPLLVKAMSKLSLYRLQEQANQNIKDGKLNEAANRLHNMATQLLSTGDVNLANTVFLEVANLRNGIVISDKAKKQIKYGTRALLLPSGLEDEKCQ